MRKQTNLKINIFIAVYVFILMLLYINSSPVKNIMGTDSSVFIAMGRGMLKGKVIYRDLFDHKGLYIFLINCLAAVISSKSLIGLFIIECIFMFASARIVYALFRMYGDEKVSFLGMQIFMIVAIHSRIIEGGNLTEEYALPFQLCAIYLVARYLHADMKEHPPFYMFLHGIFAGIVLFLRPNMIMMWGAVGILAGLDLLRRANFKCLMKNFFAGLSGLLVGSAPVMLYVAANNIIDEAVFAAFLLNIDYLDYRNIPATLVARMLRMILNPSHIILMSMIFLSCIILLRKNKRGIYTLYYLLMLFMSLIAVSLSGRKYGHYYIYLLPFVLPFAYSLAQQVKTSKPSKYKYAVSAVFVLNLLSGLPTPNSVKLMFGRTIPPEIPIAKIIEYNKPYYSENEMVLVTGINADIYNRLGLTPQEKYFYTPALSYQAFPDAADAQAASIISGINDVIIIPYGNGSDKIYPETGRSEEIKQVLESKYNLLFYDEKSNTAMYGRKPD